MLTVCSGSSSEDTGYSCWSELAEYMRGSMSSDSDSESEVIHPEEDPDDEPVSSISESISEEVEPVLKELYMGEGAREGGCSEDPRLASALTEDEVVRRG